MNLTVVNANYIKNYEIELTFTDGVNGVVDLKNEFRGPIFEKLKNVKYFSNFTVNRWTIEWENGADFAPEFLHDLVLKQKEAKHISQ